jgi:hypothetical protein
MSDTAEVIVKFCEPFEKAENGRIEWADNKTEAWINCRIPKGDKVMKD